MRSQSYSVGQSEDGPVPNAPNRVRASFQALHQPRPAILGDLHEEEVSNNQGVIPVSKAAPGPPSSALLKQALGVRHRASSTSVNAGTWSPQRSQTFSESDYAIDEADDNESESGGHQSVGMLGRGLADRRFSEMSPLRTDFSRMNDGSQRFAWNSPGFDPIDEGSQSRRHSFAVVTPHSHTRLNNSFFSSDGNIEDELSASRISQNSQPDIARNMHSPSSQMRSQNYHQEREYDHFRSNSGDEESAIELGQAHDRAFAQSYFSGVGPAMRSAHTTVPGISATAPSMVNPYAPPNVARPTKHLYIVTFKCSRSDVYYIPENVGLEVKAGDMVIVEGDRGQDLGQVTHCDVTLEDARQNLKEASEQHFRWLMMFSRHVQNGNSGLVNPNGMLAASNGEQYGREGGMGPRPPLQAPIVDDIRPKMLKRLAQGHEIQVLRDKEGAEAKAKRVCQQKAIEHGLTMEILDAEYQLDYKKLTFFYYADCYINFNHLVTDLFKVYKARIWMSAVNPASFATPSNALTQLPPPSSLGPGATSNANANGNGFPTTMTIGPSYGRGAFSAPRTPGGLEVNSTDAQQDYQEPQGRPVYHYAPSPAFGGFNPVAPAYAPTWVQNPPMNRYMPYQYGYGGGPGGGYPGNYSPFPGQEVGGSRAGEHSQNDEQDINRVLAQSLSLNQRAGS
ncbi:PSP1 domain-containing protein [Lasiodiplodia theobromae]|nr:PSP1 domain-containing protein [Lasiodiplodia theobromae]